MGGSRLARGALETAYDIPQPYPKVGRLSSSNGKSITIKLIGLAGGALDVRNTFGFEILGSDKLWRSVPIASTTKDSIIVGTAAIPANGTAIRYLWDSSPCTSIPY